MATSREMAALRDRFAGHLVRIARAEFGLNLDYSIDSVRRLEQILDGCSSVYREEHTEDGVSELALAGAAYLIKVIEAHFGPGTWVRDDALLGPGSYPYTHDGVTITPFGWCLKRIVDGPGDDVWLKWRVFVGARRRRP